MDCRGAVANHLWTVEGLDATTTLYAFGFGYSSITLMATVCSFSPSHHIGSFFVGWGNRKKRYATSPLRATTFGINVRYIARGTSCTSFAQSPSSSVLSGRSVCRIKGVTPQRGNFAARGNTVLRTCHTDLCLKAHHRGI